MNKYINKKDYILHNTIYFIIYTQKGIVVSHQQETTGNVKKNITLKYRVE